MTPTPLFIFVLKGYPRLSETFIAQEIRALERLGARIAIVALRRPHDARVHPVNGEIEAPVAYLPEYLHDDPLRVLKSVLRALFKPGFFRALSAFLRDLRREPDRHRLRRFGQACVLATELPAGASHIHSHFLHSPTSVARYAALMAGLPLSCSAHAKDIWTSPDWDLTEKLAQATFVAVCTADGAARLRALAPDAARVRLIYHGLDLDRFRPLRLPETPRDGADAAHPVRLLTVSRIVEKKGLDLLVAALGLLPKHLAWRWTHVGGGDAAPLRKLASDLGIADRLTFLGAMDQPEVLRLYRQSDLFVLPCRIARDGDRDGLPNVLVEAASQGLALLSTHVAGVPELITDGVEGRLAPPEDAAALAGLIEAMICDPAERDRFGAAALRRVHTSFDHLKGAAQMYALLTGAEAGVVKSMPGEAAV